MFKEPLVIQDQGSFFAGGVTLHQEGTYDPWHRRTPKDPANPDMPGQTLRGDHTYAFYQIPANARRLPIVMFHGALQSGKTWESTPDGREGYQTIFLRKGYGTYVLDGPRRGKAGRPSMAAQIYPEVDDETNFNILRVGMWPDYYEGVQWPRDEASLDQFCRQRTPSIGPLDAQLMGEGVSAVFDRIGDGILFTHSNGGPPGWIAAMRNPHIKALVAFEPGGVSMFPKGEAPEALTTCIPGDLLAAAEVEPEVFAALTKIPILFVWGDNIPDEPCNDPGADQWRVRKIMAARLAETINRHGGDAQILDLPSIGVKGNTHMIMADLNNGEVADLIGQWFAEKGLDR